MTVVAWVNVNTYAVRTALRSLLLYNSSCQSIVYICVWWPPDIGLSKSATIMGWLAGWLAVVVVVVVFLFTFSIASVKWVPCTTFSGMLCMVYDDRFVTEQHKNNNRCNLSLSLSHFDANVTCSPGNHISCLLLRRFVLKCIFQHNKCDSQLTDMFISFEMYRKFTQPFHSDNRLKWFEINAANQLSFRITNKKKIQQQREEGSLVTIINIQI